MSEFPEIRITLGRSPLSPDSQVTVDGRSIAGVRRVSIEASVDVPDMTVAVIHLEVDHVEVEPGSVTWLGLTGIPTDALRRELESRQAGAA